MAVFVLTKDEGNVFRLFGSRFIPAAAPIVLGDYGEFDVSSMRDGGTTKVTGADHDPAHNVLLVRGWTGILEYVLPEDRDPTMLQGLVPRVVPSAEEPQGEAVCYGDGGYYQVSEGANVPIYFRACEDAP